MNNSAGVSRKADDAYSTGAPGPCSQFLVESELLVCFIVKIQNCLLAKIDVSFCV